MFKKLKRYLVARKKTEKHSAGHIYPVLNSLKSYSTALKMEFMLTMQGLHRGFTQMESHVAIKLQAIVVAPSSGPWTTTTMICMGSGIGLSVTSSAAVYALWTKGKGEGDKRLLTSPSTKYVTRQHARPDLFEG